MRVAMVGPFSSRQSYNRMLVGALTTAGCEVMHFRGSTGETGGDRMPECSHGVSTDFRQSRRLGVMRLSAKRWEYGQVRLGLAGQLRALRPDIIHFQHCPLLLLNRHFIQTLGQTAPVALTVRDPDRLYGSGVPLLQHFGLPRLLSQLDLLDLLITHSQSAYRRLHELGVENNRIQVIQHGMLYPPGDCGVYSDDPGTAAGRQEPTRRSLITILVMGAGRTSAGVDRLIRAVRYIPDEARNWCRFVITGEPRKRLAALQDLCREHCVEHLFQFDFRSLSEHDINALAADASVCVFPHRSLGALGDLLAVMGHGKPVVAVRGGVFRELLENGVHGYLTPEGNERALADALTRLVIDNPLRNRLGENARRLTWEQPTWQDIAWTTKRCYQVAIDAWGSRDSKPSPGLGSVLRLRRLWQ